MVLWPRGTLTAGRLADGSYFAEGGRDGSITAKLGWWRAAGRLRIAGRRLDAAAAPLRAVVPPGYPAGFQATGLIFPTPGCWRVTGSAGGAHLAFVVRVVRRRATSAR